MRVLDAYDWLREAFPEIREDRGGEYASAPCPLRDHTHADVRFWCGESGALCFKCWGGCEKVEILRAVGAKWADCYPDRKAPDHPKQEIVARYDYRDESGKVLYQTVRLEPGRKGRDKDFRQRRPLPGGGWDWTLGDVRLVPYRLPELLKADPMETVFVVAGEKDVESLRALGLTATTNVGGESRPWRPEYSAVLAGRFVAVVEDGDSAGRRHADEVCGSLLAHGVQSLRRVRLPDKDATDYLRRLRVGGVGHPAALREAWWAVVSDCPAWVREG